MNIYIITPYSYFTDYTSPASTFIRKVTEALAGRKEHVAAFLEFDEALSFDMAELDKDKVSVPIEEWAAWCQEWEKNRDPDHNPFETTQIST